jgi:hypothetical protein
MDVYKFLALALSVTVLQACGGGGGGGASATLPPANKMDEAEKNQIPQEIDTGNNLTQANREISYSDGQQTIKTTQADGTVRTQVNNAVNNTVSWSADHLTKTTTYQFADGSQHPVSLKIEPELTNPKLTASVYPDNWQTGNLANIQKPLVSEKFRTFGDGFKEVIENGTTEKPFLQTTLSALNASDPNAVVQTGSTNTSSGVNTGVSNSSVIYDLRWGTPDTRGPGYASQYSNSSRNWQPSNPIYFWGQRLTNPLCSLDACTGPEISRPLEEVIDAWNKGWTGKDVNVLIEDELTGQHGVITGLLAYRYAPGANYYGFNIVGNSFATQVFFNQLENPQSGAYGSNIKLGVVNQSYTANMSALIGRNQNSGAWTTDELSRARIAYTGSQVSTINRMKDAGVTGQLTQFKFSDAVITKAAGNDSILAEYEPLNWFLAKDDNINSRLLIVGALNQAGSVDSTSTTLATYSNTAGNDADVSSRFLVASGTTPFYSGQVAIGGRSVSQGDGTSYAAPRVAGYVAIVRSKFPNLNASNTASILLDTARYDTLTCYKTPAGCDIKIYGKGEASLTRALAPVGRLR